MRARPPYAYRADPGVPPFPDERPVVVYDGVCVFCSWSMRFLLARDPELRFLAAQSDAGAALLHHFDLNPTEFDSWLLLEDGRGWGKMTAVSRALRRMRWGWPLLGHALRLIPRPIADWLYDRVAKNRYRIFGRTEVCMLPGPEIRARFIATGPTPAPERPLATDPDAPLPFSAGTRPEAPRGATSGTDRSA